MSGRTKEARTVTANVTIDWECYACGHWHDQHVDLCDFANLSFGAEIEEECSGCLRKNIIEIV